MDHREIPFFVRHGAYLFDPVDIQGVEQNFLLGIKLARKTMTVDIDETVIVFIKRFRDSHFRNVNHENIAVFVYEVLSLL